MKQKPKKKPVKKTKTPKKVKKSPKTVEPCGCGVYIPESTSYPSRDYFDYTVNTMMYLL